jgi:hypothetical protein
MSRMTSRNVKDDVPSWKMVREDLLARMDANGGEEKAHNTTTSWGPGVFLGIRLGHLRPTNAGIGIS